MPDLTENEIKSKIKDGLIIGINVDRSIFDNYQCNLQNDVLQSLQQFKSSSISVFFSQIVINEILDHLTINLNRSKDHIVDGLKNINSKLGLASWEEISISRRN